MLVSGTDTIRSLPIALSPGEAKIVRDRGKYLQVIACNIWKMSAKLCLIPSCGDVYE